MIYVVSIGAQGKAIDEYCFKACGKILVGGLDICGGSFLPCRTNPCPFEEKRMEFGRHSIFGKREKIIIRKLRGVEP